MDFNHRVLLNHLEHTKFKLLNRVFLYAPKTSNFRLYETEKCSHKKEGITKRIVTITEMFQRWNNKFVDFVFFFLTKAVLQSDLFSELVFIRTDPI